MFKKTKIGMKVEDLRIGNLVYHDGKIVKVVGIDKKHVNILKDPLQKYFHVVPIDALEPIPLTDEILVNIGFKRLPWGLIIGKLLFKDHNKCTYLELEIGNGLRVKVIHLHQLQNLYYSLTNKELNYETN